MSMPACPKVRTAIFGGSFNPLHWGHLRLAREVLRQGLADEVWLMVSPQNPLKPRGTLVDENLRLQMAREAVSCEAGIEASDFEFGLPRPSYTWHTLCCLREAYPDRCFSLLIGADNWALFDRWAHPADILQMHEVIVYPREGFPIRPESLGAKVHLLEAPLFPWSSTMIRERLMRGEDCSQLLPPSVLAFVRSHGLWQG